MKATVPMVSSVSASMMARLQHAEHHLDVALAVLAVVAAVDAVIHAARVVVHRHVARQSALIGKGWMWLMAGFF